MMLYTYVKIYYKKYYVIRIMYRDRDRSEPIQSRLRTGSKPARSGQYLSQCTSHKWGHCVGYAPIAGELWPIPAWGGPPDHRSGRRPKRSGRSRRPSPVECVDSLSASVRNCLHHCLRERWMRVNRRRDRVEARFRLDCQRQFGDQL